jgi:hypothetical protein
MWPGGWATDQHGNLAFALLDGQQVPRWACPLCRRALLHPVGVPVRTCHQPQTSVIVLVRRGSRR